MSLPEAVFNKQEYDDELFAALTHENTAIFIDTNMFALFYRLHDNARKEFFEWFKPFIEEGRIKVPAWAIQEYTNRFIRDKTKDYLSPGRKLTTITKDFKDIINFLKMNVDEEKIGSSVYSDLSEYRADIESIDDLLSKIARITHTTSDDYIVSVHKSIQEYFGGSEIESDLNKILDRVQSIGELRYKQRIPPGFGDNKKDENKFGDLIIWFEILECIKSSEDYTSAILITNDQKLDWVYKPKKVFNGTREIGNRDFKIADSRLISEFKKDTGGVSFYILDAQNLLQLVIANGHRFEFLSEAFQVSEGLLNPLDFRAESIAEIVAEPTVTAEEREEQGRQYSPWVLADANYDTYLNPFFNEEIDMLRSHNWYKQNDAISRVQELLGEFFDETRTDEKHRMYADALFVLGRNVYQAACGDAGHAVNFVGNLSRLINDNSLLFNRTQIVSGMLYEVYFDSIGEFRKHGLKSVHSNTLITEVLKDPDQNERAINFMKLALTPYEELLIVNPFVENDVTLEVAVDLDSQINISQNEPIYMQTINSVLIGERSLVGWSVRGTMFDTSKENFENRLKSALGITESVEVKMVYSGLEDSTMFLSIKDGMYFTFEGTTHENGTGH